MNTKKTEKKYFDIVNGPSRDMLFDACKYAYDKSAKVNVYFEVAVGYTAPKGNSKRAYFAMYIKDFKVTSLEHEDGSGEGFNLRGYCTADPCAVGHVVIDYKPYKFKAYYNTKTRKGSIALIEQ